MRRGGFRGHEDGLRIQPATERARKYTTRRVLPADALSTSLLPDCTQARPRHQR